MNRFAYIQISNLHYHMPSQSAYEQLDAGTTLFLLRCLTFNAHPLERYRVVDLISPRSSNNWILELVDHEQTLIKVMVHLVRTAGHDNFYRLHNLIVTHYERAGTKNGIRHCLEINEEERRLLILISYVKDDKHWNDPLYKGSPDLMRLFDRWESILNEASVVSLLNSSKPS